MRAPPGGPSLTILLLYSPKCVEEVFSEVPLAITESLGQIVY
jgi:hypothetical protein